VRGAGEGRLTRREWPAAALAVVTGAQLREEISPFSLIEVRERQHLVEKPPRGGLVITERAPELHASPQAHTLEQLPDEYPRHKAAARRRGLVAYAG
jgi:hypothetical protein